MEDCVRIEFDLPQGYSGDLSRLQNHIETNLLACVPSRIDVEQDGKSVIYAYGSAGIDMAGLEGFFAQAKLAKLERAVVTVSYGPGEEELFACPDGRIEAFHSREELEEAAVQFRRDVGSAREGIREESPGASTKAIVRDKEPGESRDQLAPKNSGIEAGNASASAAEGDPDSSPRDQFAQVPAPDDFLGPSLGVSSANRAAPKHRPRPAEEVSAGQPEPEELSFDFGRPSDANTLLVRLRVNDSTRKQEIIGMFEPLEDFRTPARVAAFEAAIAGYEPAAGYLPVRWPGFCDADGLWHWAPGNILDGFVFVTSSGPDIYLGFDMQNIHGDRQSMENLVSMFLPQYFGTDGVWGKYTMVSGKKERLFFQQDGTIVSLVRERQKTSDWDHAG